MPLKVLFVEEKATTATVRALCAKIVIVAATVNELSSFLCSIISLFYYTLKQVFTSVSVATSSHLHFGE